MAKNNFTPTKTPTQLAQSLRNALSQQDEGVLDAFKKVGNKMIKESYKKRGYGRYTGRLQSSYAYMIAVNKRLKYWKIRRDVSDHSMYPPTETPLKQMTETFTQVVKQLPANGTYLVVIASMYYGIFVHSAMGKTVLVKLNENDLEKILSSELRNNLKSSSNF